MTRLEKIMPVGRSSAMTSRQLADLLGTTRREVTRSIEAARLRGVPICSSSDADSGGFYIASGSEELADCIAEREQRTKSIQAVTTAMRVTLERMREKEKPSCAAEFGDHSARG